MFLPGESQEWGSLVGCRLWGRTESDTAEAILECKVKWAIESITTNKASGGDEIPAELFQILKNAELGQESQASSCLRKGTPLASRVAQGVSGPSSSCVWNLRVFADDARGWQRPSCCAFTHRVAFEEGSGPRVAK